MNQTDREAPKQTTPCPECGAPCIIKWSGLELVENTGDETLATKHYMFADKQLEELKQEQIETAQRIDATEDMHEKELEELRAELEKYKVADDIWEKQSLVKLVNENGELARENAELKAKLKKKEIQLSNYAYEVDRAKRDRDNAEAAKRDLLNSLDNLFTHNLNRETSKAIRELIKKYQ